MIITDNEREIFYWLKSSNLAEVLINKQKLELIENVKILIENCHKTIKTLPTLNQQNDYRERQLRLWEIAEKLLKETKILDKEI